MKLDWKGKKMHKSDADVGISIVKRGKGGGRQTSFRFRNNSFTRLIKNRHTRYIQYAVTANRIYFKGSGPSVGLAVSFRDEDNAGTVKASEILADFIGDYDLLYDHEIGLCYIDLNHKK
jgi:hypothetical protein